MTAIFRKLLGVPGSLLLGVIWVYQRTLSPDHGPLKGLNPHGYCSHEPTCSEYAIEQISRRGALIGGVLSAKQLLTCHPFRKLSPKKLESLALKSK